jgi:hypothetical protein
MKGGNMPTQLSRRTIVTMLGGTVIGQTVLVQTLGKRKLARKIADL